MRTVYIAKAVVKSSVFLVIFTVVLISLYDTSSRFRFNQIQPSQANDQILEQPLSDIIRDINKINSIESLPTISENDVAKSILEPPKNPVVFKDLEINSQNGDAKKDEGLELPRSTGGGPGNKRTSMGYAKKVSNNLVDNKPYLTSSEVDFMDSSKWEDSYNESLIYNKRFWYLVQSTYPNVSVDKRSDKSVYSQKVDNLWRINESSPAVHDTDRIVRQLVWQMEAKNSSLLKEIKPKKIVIWDSFDWWSRGSWTAKEPRQLQESDCAKTPNSITNCIFTESQDNLEDADAVIAARDSFHTGDVSVPKNTTKFYFILESPFHSWVLLNRSNDLLATYWRGSDVVTPYSKWVYYDLTKIQKHQDRNFAQGKSKPVAAFMSNCGGWNNRMGYIEELSKHIQVDVYGSCGSLICDRSKEGECFNMLKEDYYFYLAFENSNCRDYITEKLFVNGLKNDVVPVVLGAHPDDYRAMAPYKSYIHVEDFDNPAELAEYLKFLIKHPSDYNEYFGWKGTGEYIATDFFCRICAMLHYADVVPLPKRTNEFRWGHVQAVSSQMCLPKDRWYWSERGAAQNSTVEPKIQVSTVIDAIIGGLDLDKELYGVNPTS